MLFRRLAEIAKEYLKKGAAVYIEGRLRTRKWQDKEGRERYTTEIEGSEMKMLGGQHGSAQAPEAPPIGKADAEPWNKTNSTPMNWADDLPY